MSKQQVEAFKERLSVFDDSDAVVKLLMDVDEYGIPLRDTLQRIAAAEAAVHIDGLWDLAQQLMKYIEEKTNG